MRVCPVDASVVGTVMARPIWERDGTLLLAVGETVTPRMVRLLEGRGVAYVQVTDAFLPDLLPDSDVTPETRRAMHVALETAMTRLQDSSQVEPEPLSLLVRQVNQEIESQRGLLFSLSALGQTDEGTLEHAVRVSVLCGLVALEQGSDSGAADEAALGGLLHDSGKAFLPRDVLLKAGALTATDWNTMRTHPVLGYRALLRAGIDPTIASVALHHHERLDGSGYPGGLQDGQVPFLARIAMVADMWDALISERCYKPAWAPAEAAALLRKEAAQGKLDLEVTQALLSRVAVYPVGSLVELGDRRLAHVIRQNAAEPERPWVLVISDASGEPIHPFGARITPRSVQVRRIVRDLPAAVATYLAGHRDWVEDAVRAMQEEADREVAEALADTAEVDRGLGEVAADA